MKPRLRIRRLLAALAPGWSSEVLDEAHEILRLGYIRNYRSHFPALRRFKPTRLEWRLVRERLHGLFLVEGDRDRRLGLMDALARIGDERVFDALVAELERSLAAFHAESGRLWSALSSLSDFDEWVWGPNVNGGGVGLHESNSRAAYWYLHQGRALHRPRRGSPRRRRPARR